MIRPANATKPLTDIMVVHSRLEVDYKEVHEYSLYFLVVGEAEKYYKVQLIKFKQEEGEDLPTFRERIITSLPVKHKLNILSGAIESFPK